MTTAEVNKYRVWCNTDSKYVEVWGEIEPTTCPENNEHSIDVDKTVIIETLTQDFPISDIDGKKIAVHTSYKPALDGGEMSYVVWTGAGDDMSASPPGLGDGDLLHFQFDGSPIPEVITKTIYFAPEYGRVWIHEGYLMFNGAGHGDHVTADFVASATPLQTAANKIVYIENNWVKYATGSPNPATHGWAGTPVLIPRTFTKDGDWDYDGSTLTPNLAGTGEYKISDIHRHVHRFINKIPCCGSSPYFTMSSDETTEIPEGYFIEINAYNVSGTVWDATVLVEIYRQITQAT